MIPVSQDVKDKRGRLADGARSSRPHLTAESASNSAERELEIIEGIQRGLADVDAGRVIPHDGAMDQLDAVVTSARNSVTRRVMRSIDAVGDAEREVEFSIVSPKLLSKAQRSLVLCPRNSPKLVDGTLQVEAF